MEWRYEDLVQVEVQLEVVSEPDRSEAVGYKCHFVVYPACVGGSAEGGVDSAA